MPGPLTIPLISLAATTLTGLLSRRSRPKFDNIQGPDINSIIRNINAGANTALSKTTADINQAAAAGRLPSGARADALAGAQINSNRSRAEGIVNAESLKLPLARLQLEKRLAEQQAFDDNINFLNSGISSAGKLFTLNQLFKTAG